jgi:hypothetical protein
MRQLKCEMFPVTLILVTDEKEYTQLLKKSACEASFPPSGEAITIDFGSIVIVVLGDVHDALELGYGLEVDSILVHEAVHVAQFLFRYIDEREIGVEEEAYAIAYFATYLMKEWRYRQSKKPKEEPKHECKCCKTPG